jgi:ankyrin repeat protein
MQMNDLHALARTGNTSEIVSALSRGADIDAKDRFGSTALHYAIAHRHSTAAVLLATMGADGTAQDKDGVTPLHYAVEYGDYEAAVAILERATTPLHIEDKRGNQPLWTAAFNARGNYRFVTLFLLHGADSTHRNSVGLAPCDIPSRIGDSNLEKLLRGCA